MDPRRLAKILAFDLLAVLLGLGAGGGAIVFRGLIGLIHNLGFEGRFSARYDANLHTPPSPLGFFIVLVPVAGAVVVTLLVTRFAPEAKGHGVPEVMDAIYYGHGRIRPVVAVVKSLASAISIGTGGSVGREGPIVQIGSSLGSSVGQILKLPSREIETLIAVGGGAGIAATFNTPVGGVLFAVELLMPEISSQTLVPMVLATAAATSVSRAFFGDQPSFLTPPVHGVIAPVPPIPNAICYIVLGIVAGLASWTYIRSIYAFEDLLERWVRGPYVRHCSAMCAVGLLMYGCLRMTGHYAVEGVGYATVQDILSDAVGSGWLLVLLAVLKLFATSLTLGSGASGGVFSPALFLGATLGAALHRLAGAFLPGMQGTPAGFAVAGMAGLVGGSTGAPLTAIVMIFEMTRDYAVIVPMTTTVAISYGLRRVLSRDSIYTMKLARRGHRIPDLLSTRWVPPA